MRPLTKDFILISQFAKYPTSQHYVRRTHSYSSRARRPRTQATTRSDDTSERPSWRDSRTTGLLDQRSPEPQARAPSTATSCHEEGRMFARTLWKRRPILKAHQRAWALSRTRTNEEHQSRQSFGQVDRASRPTTQVDSTTTRTHQQPSRVTVSIQVAYTTSS